MRKRKPRIVVVTMTATSLRDPNRSAPSQSIYYYPAGGGTVRLGNTSAMTYATDSFTFKPDTEFNDPAPGETYAVASSGTVNVEVWDLEV